MYILVNKTVPCPILQVTPEELMRFRLSGKTGFLIKSDGKLWLAELPKDYDVKIESFGQSICPACDCICKYCPRTSAMSLSIQLGFGFNFATAVERYARPEKYDFITFAVEVFNSLENDMVVLKCENFLEQNPENYRPQFFDYEE